MSVLREATGKKAVLSLRVKVGSQAADVTLGDMSFYTRAAQLETIGHRLSRGSSVERAAPPSMQTPTADASRRDQPFGEVRSPDTVVPSWSISTIEHLRQ